MVSKHAKKSDGIQQLSRYAQIPDNFRTYVNNIVKVLQFSHVDVGPNQVHLLALLIDYLIEAHSMVNGKYLFALFVAG